MHQVVERIKPTASIFGVRVVNLTLEEFLEAISIRINQKEHVIISHVNVHGLNLLFQNPWLREFWNNSTFTFCDGFGVVLGGRILGYSLRNRLTSADWIWNLAEQAAQNGNTLYFLGGSPGVANIAAHKVQARFPQIRIVGTHHGFFCKEPGSIENQVVIDEINRLKPDYLLVGFGMPVQERWLMENWDRMDARVAMPLGAVFDYLSGGLKRAPRWMTDNGLEWLGRVLIEPGRLWKRYVIGNPLFLIRVLLQRLGFLYFE